MGIALLGLGAVLPILMAALKPLAIAVSGISAPVLLVAAALAILAWGYLVALGSADNGCMGKCQGDIVDPVLARLKTEWDDSAWPALKLAWGEAVAGPDRTLPVPRVRRI